MKLTLQDRGGLQGHDFRTKFGENSSNYSKPLDIEDKVKVHPITSHEGPEGG